MKPHPFYHSTHLHEVPEVSILVIINRCDRAHHKPTASAHLHVTAQDSKRVRGTNLLNHVVCVCGGGGWGERGRERGQGIACMVHLYCVMHASD